MTHEHVFSEWTETNKHYWSHAKTLYRTCKTCYEDEYRLLELNCPQYKIRGKNCHWCERYEGEWQKRLKTMVIDIQPVKSYTMDNTMPRKYKSGSKENKPLIKRNLAIYEYVVNKGHTYAEAENEFDITRARAYQIVKRERSRNEQNQPA